MEIEYKFGIAKDETFDFLSTLTEAGDYIAADKSRPLFTDVFYDTPDFLLFSLGYYLRKRYEAGVAETEWTLKQADTSTADVHRRNEYKERLPPESAPEDITDPDLKKILVTLAGDTPLIPILTLEQDRFFKSVYKAGLTSKNADLSLRENVLADLSVDLVTLTFSEQKHAFTELEIELVNGSESDLKDFTDVLRSLPALRDALYVNRLSKFERALALFFNRDKIEGTVVPGFEKKITAVSADSENGSVGDDEADYTEFDSFDYGFLMPREKAALIQICEKEYTADPTDYFGNTGFLKQTGGSGNFSPRSNDLLFQKASILLALDSGMSLGFTAMTYNLPKNDVLAVRRSFEFDRTDIFPLVFKTADHSAYYFQKPIADGKVRTAEELAAYYGLNRSRADLRMQNASMLFDFIGPAYGLSEKDKRTFETAAYLKGIGKGISEERKINISADILLTHPINGFSLNELKMLGLIFILDELPKKTARKIKQAITNAGFFVPPVFQKKALILSALLEIIAPADEVLGVFTAVTLADDPEKRMIEISCRSEGAGKIENLEPDSLNRLIAVAFDFAVRFKEADAETERKKEKKTKPAEMKLTADDRMADASEKIIMSQFYEAEKAETGVLSARDIEDVHDMRVALRKIRSSIIIFRDFLDPVWLDQTEEGMKRTLAVLGVLRDLDVILEKTDSYLQDRGIDASHLSVFYETVAKDRKEAHVEAVAYLTSDEYKTFKDELKETFESGVYLGTPRISRKGDIGPVRICDVLPAVLYEKAADITAYHEWMDGPMIYVEKLHRLRIAAKNFRYTLDFFKDCLGGAAGQLIKEFKELQDILGDFHDAVVAVEVIESYTNRIEEMREDAARGSKERLKEIETTIEALGVYKTCREREMEELLAAFRGKWEIMDRRFFHERISKIITEADF